MKFLPDDYQAPKSSNNYMKLMDGENKIRILSAPIFGWEDWSENKPIRFRFKNKPAKSVDPKKPIRHFWAMVVWNYSEERIQILQITQATIRNNLETLCKDTDWGAPYFYDVKIIRKGEGVDTEYNVNPLPHKDINPKVIEAFKELPIFLDALFDNADPFSREWPTPTAGIFTKEQAEQSRPIEEAQALPPQAISQDQAQELEKLLSECEPSYVQQMMTHLGKTQWKIGSVSQIPPQLFDRIKLAAIKKKQETQLEMSTQYEMMNG